MKKKLTREQHLALAAELNPVRHTLFRKNIELSIAFGSSHQVAKAAAKAYDAFDLLRSVLDSEYHRVTSDAQFAVHRHAYYDNPVEKS